MTPPDAIADLQAAFADLIGELHAAQRKLIDADPPLDEREMVEGHRWILSLLAVAADAYIWADTGRPRFVDIVGPYRKWGGDNTDAFYCFAPIDPAAAYRVRVQPGDAVYLSLTVYGGPDDGRYSERIVGSANDRTLVRSEDGGFEFTISPDPAPAGGEANWIQLAADAVCAITRDYLVDPATGRRATWSIEPLDPPATRDDSPAAAARRFRNARTWLAEQVAMCPIRLAANEVQEPYPVPTATFGWAAGDAAYAMGAFELAADEALLLEGRSPECAFWNLCLWTPYLHTFDAAYDRVTINGGQVTYEPDGSWRIVVAERDPGHPNWIATQGHRRGLLWFRWFLPDATPDRPAVRVVPVEEVAS